MINYLNIGGIQHPVRVSFYVLKHFKLETGRELSEFDGAMDIEPVLYYALEAGYAAEKRPLPFARKDIEFLLDEFFQEIMEQMPKLMSQLGKPGNEADSSKKKKT